MKNVKGFKVGDKVFAKVKGYPAWPAIITEASNTKYNVKFYGTGETGIVKPKDIFYYLKHKNKITKALKRKDYNDAIEEIESAIEECGTDGNEGGDTTSDSTLASNTSINNSVSSNNSKTGKRKRSTSVSSEKLNETQGKRKASQGSSTPVDLMEDSEIKDEDSEPDKAESEDNDVKVDTDLLDTKTIKKDEDDSETGTPTNMNDTESRPKVRGQPRLVHKSTASVDFKIVSDEHLKNLVAYAEHARKNEEIYLKKPIEKRLQLKNEIVVAKLPEGKYVGIKFNRETPPAMKNEFDFAEYEELEAKTILSLKKVVEDGTCKIEDDPDLFVTSLNLSDEQIYEAVQLDLIKRKKLKLLWLRVESSLIELDTKIKSSLGLDKADPESAIDHLRAMLKLDVDPLMLKKHPHVVDVIKRLRRYIGNVKEWKMNEDELEQFQISAERVKDLALDIYMKFSKLFKIDDPSLFWDHFSKEVEEFKRQVKDMSQSYVLALSSEPYTRRAFFEEMDAKDELRMLADEYENTDKENKTDKENSRKHDDSTDDSNDSDDLPETSNSL